MFPSSHPLCQLCMALAALYTSQSAIRRPRKGPHIAHLTRQSWKGYRELGKGYGEKPLREG